MTAMLAPDLRAGAERRGGAVRGAIMRHAGCMTWETCTG